MALPSPLSRPIPVKPVAVHTGSNRITAHLDATTTPGGLTSGDVNVGESRQIVSVIQPGQTLVIPQAGLSYYFSFIGTTAGVSNNTLGLTVRAMQKGQPRSQVIHVQGTGLRFGTFSFSGLEVINNDPANIVQFTLIVGGGIVKNSYDEFLDNRVIISQAGGFIFTQDTQANCFTVGFTARVGAWADSLGAGVTQDIPAGYLNLRRKSVIIGNDDNAAILLVLDSGSNVVGSVQPGTSFYLETTGDIKLKNPSANAVVCHIGEVYYSGL